MQFWLKLNTTDFSPRPRPHVSGYFSFRIQRCPRPHARNRIETEFAPSHVSDTYLDAIFHPGHPGNTGNRKCVIEHANFVSCSTFYDKELGSILLHHGIKKNIRIWRPHDSGFITYPKFPFWGADSKSWGFFCQIHRQLIRVDGSRVWKEKLRQSTQKVETTEHDQNQNGGKVTTRITSKEQRSLGRDRVRLPRYARFTGQYNKVTQLIMPNGATVSFPVSFF